MQTDRLAGRFRSCHTLLAFRTAAPRVMVLFWAPSGRVTDAVVVDSIGARALAVACRRQVALLVASSPAAVVEPVRRGCDLNASCLRRWGMVARHPKRLAGRFRSQFTLMTFRTAAPLVMVLLWTATSRVTDAAVVHPIRARVLTVAGPRQVIRLGASTSTTVVIPIRCFCNTNAAWLRRWGWGRGRLRGILSFRASWALFSLLTC